MTKHITSKHTANGKTYTTNTTRYNSGVSKSVTRTGGNLLSSGKITRISQTSGRGSP
jgi:hypothetical protein